MSEPPGAQPRPEPPNGSAALLALYDSAVSQVYRYVRRRCGSESVAEDLTAETFLAALDATRDRRAFAVNEAWLLTVARNKLVDHWRRQERTARLTDDLEPLLDTEVDDWDVRLDAWVAQDVLAELSPHHQGALALRYFDGLPVRDVALALGRSEGATEVLLVRARQAFRKSYEQRAGGSET